MVRFVVSPLQTPSEGQRWVALSKTKHQTGEMLMHKSTVLCYLLASFAFTSSAMAADKVPMPKTAILLTKAQIIAAYGGKKVKWSHPNGDKVYGFAVFDAAMTTNSGEWHAGKKHGTFAGNVISFDGDTYCLNKNKPDRYCAVVYQAGDTFFENDPKTGKNLSVNKIAQ
jgi:hypothetical protein